MAKDQASNYVRKQKKKERSYIPSNKSTNLSPPILHFPSCSEEQRTLLLLPCSRFHLLLPSQDFSPSALLAFSPPSVPVSPSLQDHATYKPWNLSWWKTKINSLPSTPIGSLAANPFLCSLLLQTFWKDFSVLTIPRPYLLFTLQPTQKCLTMLSLQENHPCKGHQESDQRSLL